MSKDFDPSWLGLEGKSEPKTDNYVERNRQLLVTTGNNIDGHTINGYLGLVRGIVVRSPSIAQGVLGGLKSIVGGNIESFTHVCEAARSEAYERMWKNAQKLGAHAVIAVRYDATDFAEGITEVLCYGTAVTLSSTE